jgi:large subunit ribosomal protein L10
MLKQLRPDPKQPEKIQPKTGVADGEAMPLDKLKEIPTRLEAIGDVLAALLGPGAAIAGAIAGPGTQLAGIIKTLEERAGAGAPAAESPPAPAAG